MTSRETELVAQLRTIATDPAARGLNDDCAVFGDLILTHDMMVEGVHWLMGANPEDVAWKLVSVNLSDLAAKGAKPLGVLLGYMMGDTDWDRRFVRAFGDALSHYETALWGGDTVAALSQTPTIRTIGLTAIGRATHQPVPSRSGAQVGDTVWVTGTIGAAMVGYLGQLGEIDALLNSTMRFLQPVPRLEEGQALAPHVTAMMDISDGLLLDAQRMAAASHVTIAINTATIPLPAEIIDDAALIQQALRWGDDYELLFTLPSGLTPSIPAICIGTVQALGPYALLIDGHPPIPDQPLGYEHAPN